MSEQHGDPFAPGNPYNPPGHEASYLSVGAGGWAWSCQCGAGSAQATRHESIAKRGAFVHMASERRKARYAEAGQHAPAASFDRNGDLDVYDEDTRVSIPANLVPAVRAILNEVRGTAFPEPYATVRHGALEADWTDAQLDAAFEAFRAHERGAEFNEFGEHVCSECGYAYSWPEGTEGRQRVFLGRTRRHIARAALEAAEAKR